MRILIYWQVIDLGKEGFERLMGIHGAPFLMGLRPACLLSFQQSKFTDFEGMLAEYQHCFQCKGIAQCRLAEGEEYVMILFYRSAALARMLWLPESAALLQELGYPVKGSLHDMLAELKFLISTNMTFPHEIGLFLGYPVADVRGFMEHHGHDYSCNGYWKVYANEAQARALFNLYTNCSQAFCERLARGESFPELVQAL